MQLPQVCMIYEALIDELLVDLSGGHNNCITVYIYYDSKLLAPVVYFAKICLIHSIWQIQPLYTRSKWNMGEMLPFLA
jgi:hypothetical protein